MDEKARVVLELYKAHLDRWNRRREDEWKVTLLFWTGAAVFTGFLIGKFRMAQCHLLIYLGIWLSYVLLWVRGVWWANSRDKKRADSYRVQVEALLGINIQVKEPTWKEFFRDWSVWAQTIFTLLIFLVSWFILYQT